MSRKNARPGIRGVGVCDLGFTTGAFLRMLVYPGFLVRLGWLIVVTDDEGVETGCQGGHVLAGRSNSCF